MKTTIEQQSEVRYVAGDATQPQGDGPKIIVHVCNDVGSWGRGFVVPLGKRYPQAKASFFAWHKGEAKAAPPFALGQVQFVEVADGLWVANVIGQHKLKVERGVKPIRYEAIREGLAEVATFAKRHRASVHMPRIGCGLAGGKWEQVGPIVEETLAAAGVNVVVYDLDTGS